MKLASYLISGKPGYGVMHEEGIIDLYAHFGSKYPDLKSMISNPDVLALAKEYKVDPVIPFNSITFLPVIPNPNKILCVGMNYKEKRKEFSATANAPTLFTRFSDSQIGHLQNVIKPAYTKEFDYEGELAVIIGKPCYRIKAAEAYQYIAGYSCYMDGSARDWQYEWFTAGKNWLNTGAFGPYLTTIDEVSELEDLSIQTILNGQRVQHDFLGNMVYKVPNIIEYISTFTPLVPGDVIITGSPGGVGKKRNPPLFLKAGDKIEVIIDKIGHLTNTIANE
jgi:2-keto-4-pentenoate hydratase/2-oxohepta-3-ene-1,7-dioic acid hydratase in catechol pathway